MAALATNYTGHMLMYAYVLTKFYASNVTEGDHSEATCLAFGSGSQDKTQPEDSHTHNACNVLSTKKKKSDKHAVV